MRKRRTRNTGRRMKGTGADNGQREAQAMLDVFASVGATQFDLSIIGLDGEKVSFRRGVRLAELSRALPAILTSAASKQRSVVVRPHGSGVAFVQLDDLKADKLAQLAPAVFLILKTSPGNFQAWAAITGAEDKDFARRLRKGTGADATASGATRIAGSLNFKEKYAPDFPRVAVEKAQPGRTVTAAELDQLGLVAAPEKAPARPARSRKTGEPRAWPSYERCVKGAPLNSAGNGPDISRADFVWSMTALDWGWSPEDVEARLMEESRKAWENGETYAARTVANAASAVARQRGLRRSPSGPQIG